MVLSEIGLGFVILGWLIQLVHTFKKDTKIQPWFIVSYAFGVALLIADEMMNLGMALAAWLDVIAFVLAVLVLIKTPMAAKKSPARKRKR